ncbi:MAG: 50S ribosomal protein L24 [Armatimonadetes bacterium]|nr:50S ribosomal protein L24 [Armatimonadota bacterium]
MFVHRGDQVVVISGKDIGKRGKVLEALPRDSKVIVEGINIVKRHQKARGTAATQIQSGIIEKPAPLWASKVMVICPGCEKPSRVQRRFLESGEKVRWCRECNSPIDQK